MNSKRKALLLVLCAVVLAVATTAGTFAYLTDTEAVKNTFTVGQVGLKLDEAEVNPDGTYVTDVKNRVHQNEYHLLPGHTYIKDPTATVEKGSEKAYVRMMVKVEGMESLKNAMPLDKFPTFYENGLFLLQNLCLDKDGKLTWDNNVWKFKTFHADGTYANCYEFRYTGNDSDNSGNGIVVKNTAQATVLPALFETITVPGEIDNTGLAFLKDVKIVVTAHAIQADGFADADAAWAAFSE